MFSAYAEWSEMSILSSEFFHDSVLKTTPKSGGQTEALSKPRRDDVCRLLRGLVTIRALIFQGVTSIIGVLYQRRIFVIGLRGGGG